MTTKSSAGPPFADWAAIWVEAVFGLFLNRSAETCPSSRSICGGEELKPVEGDADIDVEEEAEEEAEGLFCQVIHDQAYDTMSETMVVILPTSKLETQGGFSREE